MRNDFKKRVCMILAAMMIAMTVMPAMAEEIPEEVFEEELSEVLPDGVIGFAPEGFGMAKVMQEKAEEFAWADKITIGGVEVKDGHYLYFVENDKGQKKLLASPSNVPEGVVPVEEYAYYKDGVLTLHDFEMLARPGLNYEDTSIFHYGIKSAKDLTIELTGSNELDFTMAETPGISCRNLNLLASADAEGESASEGEYLKLYVNNDNEDDNDRDEDIFLETEETVTEPSEITGINCSGDICFKSNIKFDLENVSSGSGIECNQFFMEKCEEVRLSILAYADGIICDKFTLVPNGVAYIEINAGMDSEFAGIRSGEIMIDCPNIPSEDNILINAAGIGIYSESDIVIKSGNLTIGVSTPPGPGGGGDGTDVGIGIKAAQQIILGTDEDKSSEHPSLSIAINTYEEGIEAGEVEIDSGEIEINAPDGKTDPDDVPEYGIFADRITINGGDISVYSGEGALVLRDEDDTQKIIIAEDLRIKAGSSADDLKDVDKYSGEEAVEIIDYCGHKNVIMIEGKKPTLYEDGWKDYYKCNDCGWLYEDKECTVRIAYLKAWKTGRGKIPKPEPDMKPDLEPDPKPDLKPDPKPVPKPASGGYTAPAAKPVTTGSMENPVTGGTWKKLESGKWTFATNTLFKDTWGCIEYTKSNGEKTKGWFWFDKDGNMFVGYQEINGKKYYFCEQEGDMYGMCQLGGTAPNGQKINEDGSLVE